MSPDALKRAWPEIPGTPVSAADREVLIAQVGHLRYEPLQVLTRCPAGFPQIVLSFFKPGDPSSISTNIFWVTSPYLRVGVDRMEARGAAREIKAEVLADPGRAARLHSDQLAYHALVARLFEECLGRPPPRPGPFGIGGVRALDQVKCLHAHVACHLATGRSVIGERALAILRTELAPDFLCPPARCPGLPRNASS